MVTEVKALTDGRRTCRLRIKMVRGRAEVDLNTAVGERRRRDAMDGFVLGFPPSGLPKKGSKLGLWYGLSSKMGERRERKKKRERDVFCHHRGKEGLRAPFMLV
ncbi:hypothetical protein U1Q18_004552 [Sarracenia purpurea var. burkii]